MSLENVTLKLPRQLLSDAGVVASGQDVTIGHLVRVLLAKEVERRLSPKSSNGTDEPLVAALHALLARDMAEATGWDDLAARLQRHGYELRPAGCGIMLYKSSCGTRMCKGSELGFNYRALVCRFCAAMPGHPYGSVGELLEERARPSYQLNDAQKKRIQRSLEPIFATAEDWLTLIRRLDRCGYGLRPIGTGLAIYIADDGSHICNTATVGYRYRALVKKFGYPMPGHAHGEKWLRRKDDEPDFDVIDRGR